jgi:hypothetical protein
MQITDEVARQIADNLTDRALDEVERSTGVRFDDNEASEELYGMIEDEFYSVLSGLQIPQGALAK